MKNPNDDLTGADVDQLAQMGLAALLPGMRRMIEVMQRFYDEQRDMLAALQSNAEIAPKRMGRPAGSKNSAKAKGAASQWSVMTPEERSVEMKRRMAVAKAKKEGRPLVNHPRDPNHPNHAKWIEHMRKTQRSVWDNMSPAAKKARLAKMSAARKSSEKKESVRDVLRQTA